MNKFQWFTVKIMNGQERKITGFLETMRKKYPENIGESVYPTEKIHVKNGKKMKVREKALLGGYLFVEADITKTGSKDIICSIPGVVNILGALSKEEVDTIIGKSITEVKLSSWGSGDWCKIGEGPFTGFQGQIQKIMGEKVQLHVKIFGKDTSVDTLLSTIQRIS